VGKEKGINRSLSGNEISWSFR